MATIISPLITAGAVFTPFPSGTVGVIYVNVPLTAALALNDVIQLAPVTKGQTVHDVKIKVTDLDTNGAPAIVLDVGDGATADWLIDGSTSGQAGGNDSMDANVVPKEYTADDTVDMLVQVAPATGATTGTVEAWIYVS